MGTRRAPARHRAARRRRAGALGSAVLATFVIGSASVGVLPQVSGASPAEADIAAGALERATLPTLIVDEAAPKPPAVPDDSGKGRRIVFSESAQRVWLVDDGGDVERTYLVSGSRYDNLDPGRYQVQSRQRHATAFDSSGTMEYFVRFATGDRAAIGFHAVPVDNDGHLEQTRAQLGTPRSAGCVRQWRDDAAALWTFAPVGTKVVVTA